MKLKTTSPSQALLRLVAGPALTFSPPPAQERRGFSQRKLPPPALKRPTQDSDYLVATAASKSILPDFLEKTETPLQRRISFQIAAQMKPEEIHSEVKANSTP